MKTAAVLIAAALVCATPARSQTPTTLVGGANACTAGPGGTLAGATVRDSAGREVGWVSIIQCSLKSNDQLLVRLESMLGGKLKVAPLAAVRQVDGGVVLGLDQAQIMALPDYDTQSPNAQIAR